MRLLLYCDHSMKARSFEVSVKARPAGRNMIFETRIYCHKEVISSRIITAFWFELYMLQEGYLRIDFIIHIAIVG